MSERDDVREVQESEIAYEIAEAELALAKNTPLDTELRCWIKAQTMQRLNSYMQAKQIRSLDVAVERILDAFLYEHGE